MSGIIPAIFILSLKEDVKISEVLASNIEFFDDEDREFLNYYSSLIGFAEVINGLVRIAKGGSF